MAKRKISFHVNDFQTFCSIVPLVEASAFGAIFALVQSSRL